MRARVKHLRRRWVQIWKRAIHPVRDRTLSNGAADQEMAAVMTAGHNGRTPPSSLKRLWISSHRQYSHHYPHHQKHHHQHVSSSRSRNLVIIASKPASLPPPSSRETDAMASGNGGAWRRRRTRSWRVKPIRYIPALEYMRPLQVTHSTRSTLFTHGVYSL